MLMHPMKTNPMFLLTFGIMDNFASPNKIVTGDFNLCFDTDKDK